jgi:hypothetical protein
VDQSVVRAVIVKPRSVDRLAPVSPYLPLVKIRVIKTTIPVAAKPGA